MTNWVGWDVRKPNSGPETYLENYWLRASFRATGSVFERVPGLDVAIRARWANPAAVVHEWNNTHAYGDLPVEVGGWPYVPPKEETGFWLWVLQLAMPPY